LDAYLQDRINDVVDRFADPGFHCAVHHVVRASDSLTYPVIVVTSSLGSDRYFVAAGSKVTRYSTIGITSGDPALRASRRRAAMNGMS
jgi:hypothetical protein